MFVTIGLDEHHLHGKVRLDLYSGRIVLALDVERSRADFIISADNVEDPMDFGRGSGIIGARWQNWQCEESEGKGNCSHNGHSLFADCSRHYTGKAPVMRQNACVGSVTLPSGVHVRSSVAVPILSFPRTM